MQPLSLHFPDDLAQNISASWTNPSREAVYSSFPKGIPEKLVRILQNSGVGSLYLHQAQCISSILHGHHVIVSTGTASGKSLCYQIPIVSSIMQDRKASALLLYPTKALSTDQLKGFQNILFQINESEDLKILTGIYDGDTNAPKRSAIRNKVSILITNPDMLHIGILPHHPSWERFFSGLRFVVIDEAHSYSGVFGSHFANLIRRLKRIAAFYGSKPQFILSSATISNPKNFAQELVEEVVDVFDADYSPQGKRQIIFYNPPIVDADLGIRKSMSGESQRIAGFLLSQRLQTILFSRSRLSVEMMARKLFETKSVNKYRIAPYRSGYRKEERREIEAGLKNRTIDLVVATIALELGIDMGMVDAVLMNGYPGSITRFLQQSGRAGRRNRESFCIMVASSLPMDQYIIHHPEFIRGKHPESIFINANNPYILFNHIRSASFELPFSVGEIFGSLSHDRVKEHLSVLEQIHSIYLDNGKYYWTSEKYPAADISLRSITGRVVQLFSNENGVQERIGEIDPLSAKKFVHPGAIYLHKGDPYLVKNLNLADSYAQMQPALDSVYYTEKINAVDTTIESVEQEISNPAYKKGIGEIKVVEIINGYRRVLWNTQTEIARESLALEPDILNTRGMWMIFSDAVIHALQESNLWSIAPLDYGKNWPKQREKILARDQYTCQVCGMTPAPSELHVHHKQPVRTFSTPSLAHDASNLITLCRSCHQNAEMNLRIRGTLSGLGFGMQNIVPVFIKCAAQDIGYTFGPALKSGEKTPGIIIYDQFPGGIGLSQHVYDQLPVILKALQSHVANCPCRDGCPSCVGPGGENGLGAKQGVAEILNRIL